MPPPSISFSFLYYVFIRPPLNRVNLVFRICSCHFCDQRIHTQPCKLPVSALPYRHWWRKSSPPHHAVTTMFPSRNGVPKIIWSVIYYSNLGVGWKFVHGIFFHICTVLPKRTIGTLQTEWNYTELNFQGIYWGGISVMGDWIHTTLFQFWYVKQKGKKVLSLLHIYALLWISLSYKIPLEQYFC